MNGCSVFFITCPILELFIRVVGFHYFKVGHSRVWGCFNIRKSCQNDNHKEEPTKEFMEKVF